MQGFWLHLFILGNEDNWQPTSKCQRQHGWQFPGLAGQPVHQTLPRKVLQEVGGTQPEREAGTTQGLWNTRPPAKHNNLLSNPTFKCWEQHPCTQTCSWFQSHKQVLEPLTTTWETACWSTGFPERPEPDTETWTGRKDLAQCEIENTCYSMWLV